MPGLVQLIETFNLFLVLLPDFIRWHQLDQTLVTLAIGAIPLTTETLKKLGGKKNSRLNS
ncbi:hypothetical protein SSU05_1235 [Streptococcus suis 05ZYH33]|nr:hypothetical protein SSU05_1235 [Streptococcus suis 05ZYH33]